MFVKHLHRYSINLYRSEPLMVGREAPLALISSKYFQRQICFKSICAKDAKMQHITTDFTRRHIIGGQNVLTYSWKATMLPRYLGIIYLTFACFHTAPVLASSTPSATDHTSQVSSTMPEPRTVPIISSLQDFEMKLPGFLNPNKKLSILLDFDGTLAPISENPRKTAMTIDVEMILNKVAKLPNVFMAIISGRGITDVQERVGIDGINYAGNHGLEIQSEDGNRHDYSLPENIKKNYTNLLKELNEKVYINNAWVEDKRVSLTYHYAETPEELKEAQRQLAADIIVSHGFIAKQAHDAIEAKPPVNWHKGEAALFILRHAFGEDWHKHTRVIYAGDDNSDEDAMKSLQGMGKTFRVSTDANIQTFADFRLPEQTVVKDLLKWVAATYSRTN